MKLEKKLISLKSAKKLKELGFNIPTYYAYSPLGHIYCCGDLVDYNNYEDVLEWTSIPSLEDLLIFLDKYDFSSSKFHLYIDICIRGIILIL